MNSHVDQALCLLYFPSFSRSLEESFLSFFVEHKPFRVDKQQSLRS